MDIAALRKQTPEALNTQLTELKTRAKELQFKVAANQLKDVREIREVRRDIARVLTALHEKAKQTT